MLRKAGVLIAVTLAVASALAKQTDQPEWKYSKWSNPLYATVYDQFILEGKYVTSPSHSGETSPKLVVHCSGGKFRSGEFAVGAVVQHEPGAHSLKDVTQARVLARFDEKPKPDNDLWEISNDGQTLFFDGQQLNKLLTGHLLGHPGDTQSLVHRVIVGVVEALGNQISIEFDMPDNSAQLVDACGLEWGKGKKKASH